MSKLTFSDLNSLKLKEIHIMKLRNRATVEKLKVAHNTFIKYFLHCQKYSFNNCFSLYRYLIIVRISNSPTAEDKYASVFRNDCSVMFRRRR